MLLGQKVGVIPEKVSLPKFGHFLAWEATDSLTLQIAGFVRALAREKEKSPVGMEGGDGEEVSGR